MDTIRWRALADTLKHAISRDVTPIALKLPDLGPGLASVLSRALQRPAAPDAAPDAAAGADGRFLDGDYANEAGKRAYKLFVPGDYQGHGALVVMLHGCTQSPEDFAAGTRMNAAAAQQGCVVLYPAQARNANAQKCWNWFRAADQARDSGEPAIIAGMTRRIIEQYRIDPARVFVAGLSAGGAAAAVLGATYPDIFAAIGIHSGLACGAAHDLPSAMAAMMQGRPGRHVDAGRARVIIFQGDHDKTVNPANADAVLAQWMPLPAPSPSVKNGSVPGGRAWTRTIYKNTDGRTLLEKWVVHGGAHAWSGGSAAGSYTDPAGPNATGEMLRFFLRGAA